MDRFVCLAYHALGDRINKYVVEKDVFENQLTHIKENGYTATGISSFKKGNDPHEKIAITFDDGYISDLWAAEKLSEHGFKATFFLVEEFIKSKNPKYMDESQVKALADLGHSIGVHGKTHSWWTSKPKELLVDELCDTKKWLQDLTNSQVSSCAAVGGKVNSELIDEIYKRGEFLCVRNSFPWFAEQNSFEINAVTILKQDTHKIFLKKLKGDLSYYRYLYVKQSLKNLTKPIFGK